VQNLSGIRAGVLGRFSVSTVMQTQTHDPSDPETMPSAWPPERNGVCEHLRRCLAWYVLGGLVLLSAGGAVALLVLLNRLAVIEALLSTR